MKEAAARQNYETAARLRDQLQALRQVTSQNQKVLDIKHHRAQDVVALVRHERESAVHLFKIREGKLLSQDHFRLAGAAGESDNETLTACIKNYYSRAGHPPAEILLSHQPAEEELLEAWLRELSGRKVVLSVPRRGSRKQLMELALRNGLLKLQEEEQRTGSVKTAAARTGPHGRARCGSGAD